MMLRLKICRDRLYLSPFTFSIFEQSKKIQTYPVTIINIGRVDFIDSKNISNIDKNVKYRERLSIEL